MKVYQFGFIESKSIALDRAKGLNPKFKKLIYSDGDEKELIKEKLDFWQYIQRK